MGLESSEKNIYDLLNDRCYLVPLNQRKYVWNDNNWSELWNDINLVYDKVIDKHYIGSVVLKDEGKKDGIRNRYSIIDGQQRILTITIIICAVGAIYLEKSKFDNLGGLDKHLTVSDDKNRHYPIVSKEANTYIGTLSEKIFENLKSKTTVPKDVLISDLKKNTLEGKCFEYFYDLLSDSTRRLNTYLEIIKNICYIQIIADKQEDAYSIFESLNARGQELGDFDLLRNYLLKHIKSKGNAIKILNQIEKRLCDNVEIFLRHYVKHKFNITTKDKKTRPYKIITQNVGKGEYVELLDDLNLKSKYYDRMINPDSKRKGEFYCFKYFKSKNQRQFRPVILGLMHRVDMRNIAKEEYEFCISYLYKFFVCYHVIGEEKSNKIDDIIDKYAFKFENDFKENLVSEFITSLSKRMMDEEAFKARIDSIRFSNHFKQHSGSKNQNKAKTIMELMERINNYAGDFEKIKYNIEHINPDADSVNNSILGNLIILEDTINGKIAGKTVNEKPAYYNKSAFVMPSHIANQICSGEFDMLKRQEEITKSLYEYVKE